MMLEMIVTIYFLCTPPVLDSSCLCLKGCLKSSFLLPSHVTATSVLPKPSGLTSIVYYGQGIRHAPTPYTMINI